jgi:hypothetical protein
MLISNARSNYSTTTKFVSQLALSFCAISVMRLNLAFGKKCKNMHFFNVEKMSVL